MDKSKYIKPALTIPEILNHIESKNILIQNRDQAELHLKTVSYHRLLSYIECLTKHHKDDSLPNFEHAWSMYQFDRELRLLINDAIERIEIAFRTRLSDTMSCLYSPHWFLNEELFRSPEKHSGFLVQVKAACQNSHESQIKEYYQRYDQPPYPPSWLIFECLSFGACITIFCNIRKLKYRKMVCEVFNEHPTTMESWLFALRYMRNLCAHHSRIWNRWFVICPALSFLFNGKFEKERSCYAQLIVLARLLAAISSETDWKIRLKELMNEFTHLPLVEMGFSNNWRDDPFWVN